MRISGSASEAVAIASIADWRRKAVPSQRSFSHKCGIFLMLAMDELKYCSYYKKLLFDLIREIPGRL